MPESTPPCSSHAFAQYHNEVQDMQAKSDELVRKNKSLRNKNKGALLSC
jgi:FtsZ-binding cell division protein ZapB